MAKLKIEINDVNNIRDLLQNAYNLSDEQIVQAQNEINKLSTSSNLVDEPMDARAKYAKAINDYLAIKDKAIAKKIDIAKVLSEVYKHNGDVGGALSDNSMKNVSFDFKDIRKMVDESMAEKLQPEPADRDGEADVKLPHRVLHPHLARVPHSTRHYPRCRGKAEQQGRFIKKRPAHPDPKHPKDAASHQPTDGIPQGKHGQHEAHHRRERHRGIHQKHLQRCETGSTTKRHQHVNDAMEQQLQDVLRP